MKSSGSVQVRYTTQSGFQDNDKDQVLFRLGIQLNQFFLSITMAYKYGVPAFMAGQRHELQGDGVRLESPAFTFMAREAPRADELHRGEFLRPVYRLL